MLKKIFKISAVSRSVLTGYHSQSNEFCSYSQFYQSKKILLSPKSLRPFIINDAFIIKTTTKNEMRGVYLIILLNF